MDHAKFGFVCFFFRFFFFLFWGFFLKLTEYTLLRVRMSVTYLGGPTLSPRSNHVHVVWHVAQRASAAKDAIISY
ncbi:hypothetical protein F4861DRAFT_239766 [Xylaria intraflava]|nr:hypothetical protein F4861DRAFT_239766 [Xylaria intraflava]